MCWTEKAYVVSRMCGERQHATNVRGSVQSKGPDAEMRG